MGRKVASILKSAPIQGNNKKQMKAGQAQGKNTVIKYYTQQAKVSTFEH